MLTRREFFLSSLTGVAAFATVHVVHNDRTPVIQFYYVDPMRFKELQDQFRELVEQYNRHHNPTSCGPTHMPEFVQLGGHAISI